MPEKSGIETLKLLKEINPEVFVVMLTGHNTEGFLKEAKESGAQAFIPKPFSADKVKTLVEEYARQKGIFKR